MVGVVWGVTKPSLIAGLLAVTALAAAAAGCGGGYGDQSTAAKTAATVQPAATSTAATFVELSDTTFQPAAVDVKVGDIVTFVNKDAIAHTVTAESGAKFDSGTLAPAAKFHFVAAKAGKISYVCVFHPGMTGTIDVT